MPATGQGPVDPHSLSTLTPPAANMVTTNGYIHTDDSSVAHLPVINISDFTPEVGRQMIDAASKDGFFYIDTRGTDFTPEVVECQFELSKQFFSCPEEEKVACQIGPNNRGWSGLHSETLDPAHQKRGDFKEAFNVGEFVDNRPQQPLPKSLQGHAAELLDFETRCRSTCNRILRLLAQGLEIADLEWFSSRHKNPSGSTLRLLHYPPLPVDTDYQPEVDVRAGAHSDYGSITLLFQRPSQPGLEILTSTASTTSTTSDSGWTPVPVIPRGYVPETFFSSTSGSESAAELPPILLNIGDLLSYWTNGLLRSTVHRVIFPGKSVPSESSPLKHKGPYDGGRGGEERADQPGQDRYSIAYFCHPTDSTPLEAVPSSLVPWPATEKDELQLRVGYGGGADAGGEEVEGKKKVLTAKEHLARRLEATYGFKHA